MTQPQVGEALELSSHSAVGQWERGNVQIESVNLYLCAQRYGASLDWLVFGMKGSIEKRVAALPESLQELTMSQITAAVENAERAYKSNPKVFGTEVVLDTDPRLTQWSAKDKPLRKPRKSSGKKK